MIKKLLALSLFSQHSHDLRAELIRKYQILERHRRVAREHEISQIATGLRNRGNPACFCSAGTVDGLFQLRSQSVVALPSSLSGNLQRDGVERVVIAAGMATDQCLDVLT